MNRTHRLSLIGSILPMLALLVGCSGINLAFDITSEETVGTWASRDTTTSIDLESDGTLTATDWPVNLFCAGDPAETSDDLLDAETVDFTGTWSTDASSPYQVALLFDGDICPSGGGPATIWRGADENLALCIIIPPNTDPDGVVPNQLIVLPKNGSEGTITTATCG